MRLRTAVLGMVVLLAGCSGKGTFPEWPLPATGEFTSTGRNPFFILEPGYQLTLETKSGDRLVITVLNETKVVAGVETRIIEERETVAGALAEVSRNYFAITKTTHDVFYFGEDVDMYKDGKVTGHEGSWLAGVHGARAGLLMPGQPQSGTRFLQEVAPKVAMDQCEIVSTAETVTTPAGSFAGCVKVADSSAIEGGGPEYKTYAPGVGLLTEEDYRLVKYGRAGQ